MIKALQFVGIKEGEERTRTLLITGMSQSKSVSPYRLKKIEIKRGDAIDQIKFTYDDLTVWSSGHDGGKADRRVVIMTEGEFLVRVTHEDFSNYKCAAAAVEFETNKGRIFSYYPATLATKWKSEQKVVYADPGKEIISLIIRNGILIDCVQQSVPFHEAVAHSKEWYTLLYTDASREDDSYKPRHEHFDRKQDALRAWREVINRGITGDKETGAVLVNTLKMIQLKCYGNKQSIQLCVCEGLKQGFILHKSEDEGVSMLDVVMTLYHLLSDKDDISKFFFVTSLLLISFYFELQVALLTGSVLSLITQENPIISESHWFIRNVYTWIDTLFKMNISEDKSVSTFKKIAIIGFMIMTILQYIAHVWNIYIHHNQCQRKNLSMRSKAFSHVLSLDQYFFDEHSSSEIRGSMNVHSINNLITWNIPYIAGYIIKLIMNSYLMITISPQLALSAVLGTLLLRYGVIEKIAFYEKNINKLERKLDLVSQQQLDEAFDMMSTIKLFSKEKHHKKEYHHVQLRWLHILNDVVILRCVKEFLLGVLSCFTFGFVLYQIMDMAHFSTMTAGELTGFFLLFKSFLETLNSIKLHYDFLVREFSDIERFLTLMQAEPKIISGPVQFDGYKQILTGAIEFREVQFSYPSRPGEQILRRLNLQLQPNKVTAIVGDSGAGKSTITKLLLRMYDPTSGAVYVDGYDIRTLDLQHFHEQVAVVSQNPDLFNCSLGDNITYGAIHAVSSEEIIQAAQLANCHDFISKFRAGYDTFAGSRGNMLSGGQKQRIAIARAAIRNPKILILDEATSALDAENEKCVQKALERLMCNRTTLIIAHRLSTVRNADEIICMKAGEVVERGSHTDLMTRKGSYFQLVSHQVLQGDINEYNSV